MSEERQKLIDELNQVLHPISPNAPESERIQTEYARVLDAKNHGWWDCPIESLRWEVFHGAA